MSNYVELSNLAKIYPTPKGPAVIVKDFNLNIQKGEFVTLIGHSGCGKSHRALDAGRTERNLRRRHHPRRQGSFPRPDRIAAWSFNPLAAAVAHRLRKRHAGRGSGFLYGHERRAPRDRRVLPYCRGPRRRDAQKPAELSQGMRQRVGIARAFALKPKMLLLDEPFGMLDSLTRYELQQVLVDLWSKNNITALMVTHDVDEALFLSDRVVCMTDGPEAEVGDILPVNFPRPRERKAVMEHPDYYRLRERQLSSSKSTRIASTPARSPPRPPRQLP